MAPVAGAQVIPTTSDWSHHYESSSNTYWPGQRGAATRQQRHTARGPWHEQNTRIKYGLYGEN
jgi:hypothetical protein